MEYKEALEYLEIMRKFFTDDDVEGEVLKQTYDVAVKTVKKQMQIEDLFNGYDLNRLKELAEADKEGRCLVLPCKVGDTVYVYDLEDDTDVFKIEDYKIYGITIYDQVIYFKSVRYNNKNNGIEPERVEHWFKLNDIGESVFLTAEEAKKATEGLR